MPPAPVVEAHGMRIPAIGLGTWPMKGEECARAVTDALRLGYRHVDTAFNYGNEADVGAGLKASGVPREEVFLTTKVWWDKIDDGDLQRSAEASLKNLAVAAVDLLLIHWPNPRIPLARSIKALCEVKRRGLARHIGISNFPSKLMAEALALTTEPLACHQGEYHAHVDQSKVLALCRKHAMAFTAYTPLGRGTQGGVISEPSVIEIARRLGRTPAQVALRWLVQQPGVVAVPKSSNPQRLAENLDVFSFALTDADMAALSKLARPDGRVVSVSFAPEWD